MHINNLVLCKGKALSLLMITTIMMSGCGSLLNKQSYIQEGVPNAEADYHYIIGPGDQLNIFVWRNPEISSNLIPVRPDGRISSPLVEDLVASGKTPTQLAREIEAILEQYIKEPLVTITVTSFEGRFDQQIRVIGEATVPSSIPYRSNMSLLDVMIVVGGLTEFAAGNKASIVRNIDGEQRQINIRLQDLIKGGDISANINMAPGDIVVIPESLF